MNKEEHLVVCKKYEKDECTSKWNGCCGECLYGRDFEIGDIADHLLANGVIVPPCKVGQVCYKVCNGNITEAKVTSICYEPLPAFSYLIRFNTIGALCLLQDGTRNERYSWDIYLTRDEAENALAERRNRDAE